MRLDWKTVSLIIAILEKLNSVFDFVGYILKACKWIAEKVKQLCIKIMAQKK